MLNQMKKNVQKGFTLIELMIVIAIIGILAAIAIPAYQDYTIRAQASEALSLLDGLKTPMYEYYTNKGTWPTNTTTGFVTATSYAGNYVASITLSNTGTATATYGGNANAKISGSTMILSATTLAGSVKWACTGGTLLAKYRPSSCR
ncbi:MAG: pilin [Halothiobacillus sp.]